MQGFINNLDNSNTSTPNGKIDQDSTSTNIQNKVNQEAIIGRLQKV